MAAFDYNQIPRHWTKSNLQSGYQLNDQEFHQLYEPTLEWARKNKPNQGRGKDHVYNAARQQFAASLDERFSHLTKRAPPAGSKWAAGALIGLVHCAQNNSRSYADDSSTSTTQAPATTTQGPTTTTQAPATIIQAPASTMPASTLPTTAEAEANMSFAAGSLIQVSRPFEGVSECSVASLIPGNVGQEEKQKINKTRFGALVSFAKEELEFNPHEEFLKTEDWATETVSHLITDEDLHYTLRGSARAGQRITYVHII